MHVCREPSTHRALTSPQQGRWGSSSHEVSVLVEQGGGQKSRTYGNKIISGAENTGNIKKEDNVIKKNGGLIVRGGFLEGTIFELRPR